MAEQDAALSEFSTEWVNFGEAAGNPLVRRLMPLLEEGRRVEGEEQRFRVRLEPGVNAGTRNRSNISGEISGPAFEAMGSYSEA